MFRFSAAKRAFATTSFRPSRPPVSRPIPPSPPPAPRVGPVIRPTPLGSVNSARHFGTGRRLAKLKDQGPFGDGFMDIGCKTIKVLLALVLVNVVVVPMWDAEKDSAKEEASRAQEEVAKMAISK